MKANTETTTEIAAVLKRFVQCYAAREDANRVLEFFGEDDDVTVIGTDEEELRRGQAAVRAQVVSDWSGPKSSSLTEIVDCDVSESGNVAWARCGVVRFSAERNPIGSERLTVVLERRDGRWVIMQWHKSRAKDARRLSDGWTKGSLIHRELARHLRELAHVDQGSFVVDIACGSGTCAAAFAPEAGRVRAFDVSIEQVANCQRRASELGLQNLTVMQLDLETRWPLDDHSVDIITGVGALSNFQDPAKALVEAARVLKRNGQLLLGDFFVPRGVWEVWGALSAIRFGAPRSFLDYQKLMGLLRTGEFSCVQYRPIRWRSSMDDTLKKLGEQTSPEMRAAFIGGTRALSDDSRRALGFEIDGESIVVEHDCFALRAQPASAKHPIWRIDSTRPVSAAGQDQQQGTEGRD